jgi:hypothetical protein
MSTFTKESYTTACEKPKGAGRWWLTPVILTTQEAEIRRIIVQSQPRANSLQDPILKKIHHKKGLGGGASKPEALCSNPSAAKNKKEEEEKSLGG